MLLIELMENELVNICNYYFKVFSEKKINELSQLFSDDITLRDWENNASGKPDVLNVNEKIFKSAVKINVFPLNFYKIDNIVIAELEITINNKEKILVVDIISFNNQGKISSIKAFKG